MPILLAAVGQTARASFYDSIVTECSQTQGSPPATAAESVRRQGMPAVRIVYVGSSGPLSVMPLQALLEQGAGLCAVAQRSGDWPPVRKGRLETIAEHTGSVGALAGLHDLPVIPLDDWPYAVDQLRQLAPDVILVSCFAQRLPANVLTLPVHGCFNLHPSLLPAYRGPDPLFWQFRDGTANYGISWHRMSKKFDAGAVVARAAVTMPDGVSGAQSAMLLGEAANTLLENLLRELERGTLLERVQDEARSSYQGFPRQKDFDVSPSWSARRLYNFMCATRDRGRYYRCTIEGRSFRLLRARSWQAGGFATTLVSGNSITFACHGGTVTADFM